METRPIWFRVSDVTDKKRFRVIEGNGQAFADAVANKMFYALMRDDPVEFNRLQGILARRAHFTVVNGGKERRLQTVD